MNFVILVYSNLSKINSLRICFKLNEKLLLKSVLFQKTYFEKEYIHEFGEKKNLNHKNLLELWIQEENKSHKLNFLLVIILNKVPLYKFIHNWHIVCLSIFLLVCLLVCMFMWLSVCLSNSRLCLPERYNQGWGYRLLLLLCGGNLLSLVSLGALDRQI